MKTLLGIQLKIQSAVYAFSFKATVKKDVHGVAKVVYLIASDSKKMHLIIRHIVKIPTRLSILVVMVNLTACNQKPNKKLSIDPEEVSETKSLLQFYFNKELERDAVFLYEQPSSNISQLCSNEIVSKNKNLGLTSADLINRLQKETGAWSASIAPYAVILHQKDVLELRKNSSKYQELKYKNTEPGYFILSNPVFLKSYRFAIIHSVFLCGDRCGEEYTLLFEKRNKIWFLSGKYCYGVF